MATFSAQGAANDRCDEATRLNSHSYSCCRLELCITLIVGSRHCPHLSDGVPQADFDSLATCMEGSIRLDTSCVCICSAGMMVQDKEDLLGNSTISMQVSEH